MKSELRELESKAKGNFKTLSKTALWHSLNQNIYPFGKEPNVVLGLDKDTNYLEIISGFSFVSRTKHTVNELYECFNQYVTKLGYNFAGICIPDEEQDSLLVRTYSNNKEINNFKFSLSDEYNYLVQTYNDRARKFSSYKDLFYINCPSVNEYIVIPLVQQGDCQGIVIAGSLGRNRERDEVFNTLSGYLSLLLSNHNLRNTINSISDLDSLTGLYTHRKFHETLTQVLSEAEEKGKKVSVAIYDINNISGINREYGHSLGDEVILNFSKMLKSSIRKTDIAARYGGDEIAVIMPDTDNEKALELSQKIISKMSKNEIEKIGKIKASVGIATYPTSADDKEKLILLAEQSMLISGKKTDKSGKSYALSTKDVDFWNKIALDSLSKAINRQNFQHSFSFEEELVKQLQHQNQFNEITMEVVTSLAAAIDAKDTYTKGHSQSVSFYAEKLARAVELDESMVERIKLAAVLHDVGKIGIPESILRKPGPLTDHEWEVMKQHPVIGVKKILEPVKSLNDLIPIVKHHHERVDGNGYPSRLKGDEIPIGAKIVAIADAFHALISNRPYRKSVGSEKAIETLKAGAGVQWDKDLVEKFINITPLFFINKKS